MQAAAKLVAFVDEVSEKASNEAIQPTTPAGVSACSSK
jgi:ATP-binding protein involved in chromosome partitioning